MKRISFLCLSGILLGASLCLAAVQEVETADGVRFIHNVKGGIWGGAPKVGIELVRKIGDVDAKDENLAFNLPNDVAVDSQGNIHILDAANSRIQKFGPDGTYLATIGRKGQGPMEFMMPDSVNFDAAGGLVVLDSMQRRFQIQESGRDAKIVTMRDEWLSKLRCLRSGLFVAKGPTYPLRGQTSGPLRLIKVVDEAGKIQREFGTMTDFGEVITNSHGNTIAFDVDPSDAILVVFLYQNRIEKYAADGRLIWRADRSLNYGTEVKKRAKTIKQPGRGTAIVEAEMNSVAVGIAADEHERAWIATFNRQLKESETVHTRMIVSGSGTINQFSAKVVGDTDLRTTDALKLEVFDADGILLGELPLTHFVDAIRIAGDFLFLIDSQRGATVYQYKIIEK
ncbi:MAG: 6-bladed beta-propeller [Candidatus Aminicenantes bacterium]|nr:6-bladed beta-propeller [Candidatus Aminicenantes bacterium]